VTKFVYVYDKITGRKLGPRPESWLRFDHIAEVPSSKRRRSPKKSTATPAAEPSSEATDTAPEEEK
jgi:hypothetical protein